MLKMFCGIFRRNLSFAAIVAVLWILNNQNQSLAQEVSTDPVATLFSELECKGLGIVTRTSLPKLPFNNRAKSVMARGVWIFYEYERYNDEKKTGVVEYIYNQNEECVNFKNIRGKISSLQVVGSLQNSSESFLNLFKGNLFQGTVQVITSKAVKGISKTSSLIITGSSPWTFYSKEGLKGSSVCVKPPNSNNLTPSILVKISIIWNGKSTPVKSVQKGCHGKTSYQVVVAQSNTQEVGYTLHGVPN